MCQIREMDGLIACLWFRLKRWYIFTWQSCQVQFKISSLQLSSFCCSAVWWFPLAPKTFFYSPNQNSPKGFLTKGNFTPKPGSIHTLHIKAWSSLTFFSAGFSTLSACLSVTWALCTFPCTLANYCILVCLLASLSSHVFASLPTLLQYLIVPSVHLSLCISVRPISNKGAVHPIKGLY